MLIHPPLRDGPGPYRPPHRTAPGYHRRVDGALQLSHLRLCLVSKVNMLFPIVRNHNRDVHRLVRTSEAQAGLECLNTHSSLMFVASRLPDAPSGVTLLVERCEARPANQSVR